MAGNLVIGLGGGWRVERSHCPSYGWKWCCYQMGPHGVVPGTGRGGGRLVGGVPEYFDTKEQAVAAVEAQRATP